MRTVEEALAAVLDGVRPMSTELVPLDRAAGRVPAAFSVRAAVDVPPFDNSAMDGFAVRAADAPGLLRLAGEAAAGSAPGGPLAPGAALRIMTGAPLPEGADAVVPLEVATESDGGVRVPATTVGAHVRPAGGDTRAGETVELPAAPLGAAGVAVLASLGVGEVEVRRRPRVAILSTGDELRPPGTPLGPGQIHDANSAALAAAVLEAGGEPLVLARVADDEAAIAEALLGVLHEADVVIASGGVSVGRHDHVRPVIERHGSLALWRIAMQPGKPLAVGHLGAERRPVLGLPGNPVSAIVTFELFGRPLVRALLGLAGDGRSRLRAVAGARLPKDIDRRAYLRVILRTAPDGGYRAEPAGGQASNQLRPLASANALLVVPEGEAAAEPGDTYDAIVTGELT